MIDYVEAYSESKALGGKADERKNLTPSILHQFGMYSTAKLSLSLPECLNGSIMTKVPPGVASCLPHELKKAIAGFNVYRNDPAH